MRKKWGDSDHPTLQVALYKIISSDEEAHRLNGSRQEIDHTTKGESMNERVELTDEQFDKVLDSITPKGQQYSNYNGILTQKAIKMTRAHGLNNKILSHNR